MLSLAGGVSTTEVEGRISHAHKEGILRYQGADWWKISGSPKTQRVFKQVIDLLLKKNPTLAVLSPRQLSERLRQTAWYISGVANARLLDQIREVLVDIRVQGGSQREFIEAVVSLTDRAAPQIETVFRTNIASATGAARWAEYNDEDVADLYFGYRYLAKEDERARPLHRLMNGFIAVKEDPIWPIIWIPNGYNCRCKIRPLRRHQAEEVGLINKRGEFLRERIYANQLQRRVVSLAESGGRIRIGKRWESFPDEHFTSNMLFGLVA
jgi:SPP1 gp7 family putative phage head morphogenesis protein